jgi:nicotinate-nucleotide adenylyltransferase
MTKEKFMSALIPEPKLSASARWRGLRVGILGGSFNPPHAGHLHIARLAMIQFHLDAVWWLVTPGNPLKTKKPTDDLQKRMGMVRAFIATQPKMVAADLEAQMGTRYTIDTARALVKHFPQTQFLWIAGMDNAAAFTRWRQWREIPTIIPFVFYDRPPATAKLKTKNIRENKEFSRFVAPGASVKKIKPGIYWVMGGAALNLSSTQLRQDKE